MKNSECWIRFRPAALCAGLIILLCSIGCARVGVNLFGEPMISAMVEKIQHTGNAQLVQEGIAGQVLMVTAMAEISPENVDLLKECAFLYCTYGLFVEDEKPKFARELYSIGKKYGLMALKQDAGFRKGLQDGKKISEIVKALDSKYAEVLCWTGLNSGLLLILNLDDPSALIEMADIIAMVEQSVKLNENYFYGAGKLFLGAYYALVPSFLGLGGGPDSSAKMFQKAREVTDGKFLLVDLFEGRFLGSATEDEELFERRLQRVLTAESASLKEITLINELAKKKAKYYLDHREQFF